MLALIDGTPGAVWSVRGEPRVVFDFTVDGDRIVEIMMTADPARLEQLEAVRLPSSRRSEPPNPIPSSHREPSP